MLPVHRYLEGEVNDGYTDDLGEEEVVSFEGYIESTNHYPHLFAIAIIICAISIVAIPLFVALSRRYLSSTHYQRRGGIGSQVRQKKEAGGGASYAHVYGPTYFTFNICCCFEWFRVIVCREDTVMDDDDGRATEMITPPTKRERSNDGEQEIIPSPDASLKLRCTDYLQRKLLLSKSIVKHDKETQRLLGLALPFTLSAVLDKVADLITLAIIAHCMGEDAMLAYVLVISSVAISESFMTGYVEALSSLGSMAYEAGNYELAGQYLQGSIIIYVICEIPMILIWGNVTDKLVLLLGFDESVSALASSFVWVYMPIIIMAGINEAFLDFLDVVDRAVYANIMYCISSIVKMCIVAFFVIKMNASLSLNYIGHLMLAFQIMFFFLNAFILYATGWLDEYQTGMFRKFALRNRPAMKTFFKTALPLSFGGLFVYAEWEILLVFASILGPAEAATWAILGFVWEVFESTTEAIGDAAEVRCAYQLGKGRPGLAELSAYKSILMASVMSVYVTIVFVGLRNEIPAWLTPDGTLQSMLADLFPLIALGNITMTVGMVSWAIVGAQGRYRVATAITIASSLLFTIPFAAISTIWLRLDLQGLIFAVVVGNIITATLFYSVLLLSDWKRLSKKVMDKMTVNDETDSDTDSEDSDYKAPDDIAVQGKEGRCSSDYNAPDDIVEKEKPPGRDAQEEERHQSNAGLSLQINRIAGLIQGELEVLHQRKAPALPVLEFGQQCGHDGLCGSHHKAPNDITVQGEEGGCSSDYKKPDDIMVQGKGQDTVGLVFV